MNITTARQKVIGKRSQQKGVHGEQIARLVLDNYGVRQLCKIETGWRVHRGALGKIVSATPVAQVAGDFRGVWCSGGTSVMVEVKERKDKVIYSDIKTHQHTALREHNMLGGISLVVCIFENFHCGIVRYPCDWLIPRLSGLCAGEIHKFDFYTDNPLRNNQ